jgi:hypothetical protein
VTKPPMCGAARPCTLFSRLSGERSNLCSRVHIADTILSSDPKQMTVGLRVQATILLSWLGDASDRATR